jgi:glycine/D-amino acid oxidase-like deaminating enzyme
LLNKSIVIIGGGVAGLSALYQLTKSQSFAEITLIDAPQFFTPCSLNSTAIVAPRGVTAGLSTLGDTILAGYECFRQHVADDVPEGVEEVLQTTGALTKLDQFKKRYPASEQKGEFYYAHEKAWLINPEIYLGFLRKKALSDSRVRIIRDLVISIDPQNKVTTQNGLEKTFDHVLFASGVRNALWKSFFKAPSVQSSKIAQGSYFEFHAVDLGSDSFSLTLEGDNLIYHAPSGKLLIGSSIAAVVHELAPLKELTEIYRRLSERSGFKLPDLKGCQFKTGLREKASKREPYVICEGEKSIIGGLYKNGFSLSLYLSHRWLKLLIAD